MDTVIYIENYMIGTQSLDHHQASEDTQVSGAYQAKDIYLPIRGVLNVRDRADTNRQQRQIISLHIKEI